MATKKCEGECPHCGFDTLDYIGYESYEEHEQHLVQCLKCKRVFTEFRKVEYAYTEYEEGG